MGRGSRWRGYDNSISDCRGNFVTIYFYVQLDLVGAWSTVDDHFVHYVQVDQTQWLRYMKLVAAEDSSIRGSVGSDIDFEAKTVLQAQLSRTMLAFHALKDRSQHPCAVVNGEVAHEAEGSLRECDYRWYPASVVLLGGPQERTVAP